MHELDHYVISNMPTAAYYITNFISNEEEKELLRHVRVE